MHEFKTDPEYMRLDSLHDREIGRSELDEVITAIRENAQGFSVDRFWLKVLHCMMCIPFRTSQGLTLEGHNRREVQNLVQNRRFAVIYSILLTYFDSEEVIERVISLISDEELRARLTHYAQDPVRDYLNVVFGRDGASHMAPKTGHSRIGIMSSLDRAVLFCVMAYSLGASEHDLAVRPAPENHHGYLLTCDLLSPAVTMTFYFLERYVFYGRVADIVLSNLRARATFPLTVSEIIREWDLVEAEQDHRVLEAHDRVLGYLTDGHDILPRSPTDVLALVPVETRSHMNTHGITFHGIPF